MSPFEGPDTLPVAICCAFDAADIPEVNGDGGNEGPKGGPKNKRNLSRLMSISF